VLQQAISKKCRNSSRRRYDRRNIMKKGTIVGIEPEGKWIKKKKQVYEKGLNLVVKNVDNDVIECWVIRI
jgi:hypothetical protein